MSEALSLKARQIAESDRQSPIPCPECDGVSIGVTDSRPTNSLGFPTIRRRRLCADCGHRWVTIEVPFGSVADMRDAHRAELQKEVADAIVRAALDALAKP